MKKLIAVILLMVCLSVLFAMPADAAEYTDPLAVKFDDTVGYCDMFYDTLEWYVVCKLSWTFVDWDYEGEPPKVQVPAAEYEAEVAKYCVLSDELLTAIRNYEDYNGNPIYDPETNIYTAFYVGGWGGSLPARVYAGYVKTGEDTYDVYYEKVTYEFLEDILPEGTTIEDIVGEEWPETVEYGGQTYANGPDGYYRLKSYDKSGIKYGVKLDGDSVLLATRTPYAVGAQPDSFDDVTIEDILTYEIVDGEAIITDCAETATGSITIPDTLGGHPVTKIGDYAFENCINLTDVAIGENTTVLGEGAFMYCSGLTSVSLGNNTTMIGNSAFQLCSNLAAISIPNSVTRIGNHAFAECHNLSNVTMGNGISNIGNSAFWCCCNLSEINIPEGIDTIGDATFQNCERLTDITIPDSVTAIGDYAFWNCLQLTDVYYGGAESQWSQISIGEQNPYLTLANFHFAVPVVDSAYLSYNILEGGAYIYACDSSVTGNIAIPETLGGYPVVGLDPYAFQNCTGITEIHLPDSVISINYSAFEGCSGLTTVTMGDHVTSIGDWAFMNCTSLADIDLSEGLTDLGHSVFYGCESLTEIVIPNGITAIEDSAFNRCTGLESITIPGSVATIGEYAFANCTSLTEVTIPYGVTLIGDYAFSKCTSLASISLSDGLISIGEFAFKECSRLRSITIPDSVINIGNSVFEYCSNLKSAIVGSGISGIPSGLFQANVSLTAITIPDGITYIEENAFYFCDNLTDVYYRGTQAQKDSIAIYDERITSATWYYESCIGAAEHTHDNACDTECNVCGAMRSIIHTYDNPCDNLCNICGDFRVTQHVYTDFVTKATLTEDGSIENKCSGCGAPSWTATIVRPTTFTLSTTNYTYNGQAKKPAVTVKDADGAVLVNGTDYTVTYPSGCTALGSYKVTITMKGNYSGTKTLTFNIKLATPTVKATNAVNGVKITWNKIAGATNYKVYKSVYTSSGWTGWTAIKTGVTGTSYTDTTVKSGHNVRYTVRAFNGSNSSTFKASNSIKFLATPTVKASNAVNGVKITWNAVGSAKSYIVYKSTYSGGKWSGWTRLKTGVTGTTYTDTTVKSNDNVRYTVKAINGNFTSYIKASNSIKFLATPTVKVANTATGVKITWNKVAGAKSYIVYRSVYSGGKWSGWTRVKTGVTGTSYTDTTVKSGATVRYTVKAINGNFTSYIKASSTTKYLAQPTVKVAKTTNGIKASWGKSAGATGYIVYRRTYANGKWSGWTAVKTTSALSYTDTTAKTGVYYQYTVRAYSGSYKSSFKNSSSIKR